MFEWNEEEGRLEALHHPFTAPHPDDLAAGDLRGARALAYDLVYNGIEVAGARRAPRCARLTQPGAHAATKQRCLCAPTRPVPSALGAGAGGSGAGLTGLARPAPVGRAPEHRGPATVAARSTGERRRPRARAGGSLRTYRRDVQERVFAAVGLGEAEAVAQFGYLLEAFQLGAPPHGGLAFGLDRWAMLLAGVASIRDVIAFPKTAQARRTDCLAVWLVQSRQHFGRALCIRAYVAHACIAGGRAHVCDSPCRAPCHACDETVGVGARAQQSQGAR